MSCYSVKAIAQTNCGDLRLTLLTRICLSRAAMTALFVFGMPVSAD